MAPTDSWYLERVIFLIAGIFILLSLFFGFIWSPYWFILTFLVGINLIIFALTGFCIMANILYKLGLKSKIK
jgi:cellulose synthase/poly-beta-1,6-N-acetylglucosamine synthase-like glycosyltransferase